MTSFPLPSAHTSGPTLSQIMPTPHLREWLCMLTTNHYGELWTGFSDYSLALFILLVWIQLRKQHERQKIRVENSRLIYQKNGNKIGTAVLRKLMQHRKNGRQLCLFPCLFNTWILCWSCKQDSMLCAFPKKLTRKCYCIILV